MQNLNELSKQVRTEYAGFRSYVVPSQLIRISDQGLIHTGKNKYPLSVEGLKQLAQAADIPISFFIRLPVDLRSITFNRLFQKNVISRKIDPEIRLNLDKNRQVVGFDDPKLLRIGADRLMEAVCSSLPEGLSAEQIEVDNYTFSPNRLHFSCFSPMEPSEPQPGDIINWGIDVLHSLAGDDGTKVFCYLRRLICKNGAIAHICSDDRQLRARRLDRDRFHVKQVSNQIHRLLSEAWIQSRHRLSTIKTLLDKNKVNIEFLRQQRTRFSLNNRTLDLIERALNEDEFGETKTQYDVFNALSRVATHDNQLSFRQRRVLSRMAGELTQQTAHKCNQCGQWVVSQN